MESDVSPERVHIYMFPYIPEKPTSSCFNGIGNPLMMMMKLMVGVCTHNIDDLYLDIDRNSTIL